MRPTTRAQREALFRLWRRGEETRVLVWQTPTRDNLTRELRDGRTYLQFRRRFRWGPFGDTYVGGPWRGMYVGVELDGHTHT